MASVKCCKCGHEWETRQKSYGHPRWCPECKNPHWDSGGKKEYVFDRETAKINLSDKTFENMWRLLSLRRDENLVSFALIVDELLENPTLSETIRYRNQTLNHSMRISKESYEKLNALKKESGIKRIDEVLWRVMHNDTNRKLWKVTVVLDRAEAPNLKSKTGTDRITAP
jgi:hypothetical protein